MERHQGAALSGRVPLAVVVVEETGTISHWSSGARALFGCTRQEAVGAPAVDLLPIAGALGHLPDGGPDGASDGTERDRPQDPADSAVAGESLSDLDDGLDCLDDRASYPSAGRARVPMPVGGTREVLWWAYPLYGTGPERLLVLAADADRFRSRDGEDSSGAPEDVAPGFALHTEFSGADELVSRLPDILPSMSPADSARIVSQVLDLGYPVLEFSLHSRVPVTPDWGVPLRRPRSAMDGLPGPGGGPGAVPSPRRAPEDDDGLENAAVRERLEFLNEVSASIGATLDLARTVQEVTDACVPRFADFSGTHLRDQVLAGEGFPDGPPDTRTLMHRVWVTHNDEPGRWDDTVPVGETFAFPEDTPFYQCMTTGRPVLIPRLDEELAARIAGRFEKRDLRPLITGRSLLIVPLLARRVVLGFTVLMRRPDRPPFDEMDRTTAAELAARAGLVLDNARLYTYQEQAAETLQSSMLPQNLPRVAGVDIATRYLPGTRLGRVGGDWFDTIKLPGSRVALVVGDVMGHGMHSAAMMGQLRTAVQTMAALDLPPAQLLRNLDDLAQRLGDTYLATCLYLVYDPVESSITLSNAGHIPPVVVRADGSSELLEIPTGAPIGVGGVPFETATLGVGSGDRLVLCTDGLVEVRGQDIGEGLAALCESAAHPAASMDDACDTIIRALAAAPEQSWDRKDDVALLMARLNGIPKDRVASWELALDPREVRRARRVTRAKLEEWGLDQAVETAELLVGELVTNALRHAHRRHVELRLLKADNLLCEVTDDNHSVPVLLNTTSEHEFGRGMRLVSRLALQWGTSRTSVGKTVWFEQAVAPR
ncbi:SpoIIE family protein phosphatase [Wenjunlia tyrosinilytica]|uniref:PAS domain-containing protein n=1 Tax=Wenjunlia tyrosinilytica TaxID=1544741 RepID=A0A918E151_9ACTN|nr:SpoIIE family protein phosphatase [Wenjunlia tyrosinilytica]GGO95034.1 hypothetical protein GCM10012280_51320 [Wenjunlia tyrosinilytica]